MDGPEQTKGKPSVLLVDDDTLVLRSVARLLRSTYQVSQASSVDEAQTHLEETQFAVVIVDLYMPEQGGLRVLRVAEEKQPAASRVLHTGANLSGLREHIDSGLVHHVIAKPVEVEVLLSVLASCVALWVSKVELGS